MKILMIEDERDLAEAVAEILRKNNFTVEHAFDGEYGLDCALTGVYDLIILDIMLPKMDGLHVLKELRSAGVQTSVLMLTARGEIRDKVNGLDCGADDYLPKPFHTDELLARLRALSRRKGELLVDGIIESGSLRFNPHTLTLTLADNNNNDNAGDNSNNESNNSSDKEINLTLKESQLLELLLTHKDSYISKDMIIEKLWSYDADVQDSHVENQVSLLRRKLASAGFELSIKSARGVGYRIEGLKD